MLPTVAIINAVQDIQFHHLLDMNFIIRNTCIPNNLHGFSYDSITVDSEVEEEFRAEQGAFEEDINVICVLKETANEVESVLMNPWILDKDERLC